MIARTDHRPWPLPSSPWLLFMRWKNLAFLHWPFEPQILQRHLPHGVPIDTFDGKAWLGITPFEMSGTRPRFLPPIPGVSNFPELNVRTYVTIDGKPGVWFLSLDAGSSLAVHAARLGYCLPYYNAEMSLQVNGNQISYRSERQPMLGTEAQFEATYRPTGDIYRSVPGNLDHWLTERYCLYVSCRGRVFRGEIHHDPWPLQPAAAEIRINTMAQSHDLNLPPIGPLVHFSRSLDVVGWYLQPV